MGDRAVIVVHSERGLVVAEAALYLHWAGGAEGVGAIIGQTLAYMRERPGDESYFLARLAGIAHNEIPGPTSVGLIMRPELIPPPKEYSHGDCSVICVSVGGPGGVPGMGDKPYGHIDAYHGYLANQHDGLPGGFVDLMAEIRKHYPEATCEAPDARKIELPAE